MFSRALRCLVVWLLATVPLTTLGWLAVNNLLGAQLAVESGTLTGQSFETLLLWLCSAAITACCGWLWATTTVAVIAITRGHVRSRVRGCPEFVHRAVLVACGVAIAGSLTLPVHAADGDGQQNLSGEHSLSGDHSLSGEHSLSGLPLPDRTSRTDAGSPVGSPVRQDHGDEAAAIRTVDTHPATEDLVTVHAGDTLWDLASETLAADATPAEIAERTNQLHRLNREVVGADPDRIYPGQELRLPGGEDK